MKTLLLLTNSFPFGSGEEFLSAELKQSSGFDEIFVCPCSRKAASVQTKLLPAGVRCIPLARKSKGLTAYVRLWFRPCVQAELFRLLRAGRFSPGRVHELLFFMKNADEIFDALKRSISIRPGDSAVIYSYWLYDAAAAGVRFAAFLRKQGVRVRQISRAHGFDIHSERAAYGYLPMRAYLFRHLDHVYPCSDNGADVLKQNAGRYAAKITRAYLGTEDRGTAQQSRTPFHLVSCSYLVPVKRLHLIAEALKQADFPVVWTHIGSGPLEKELRAKAEELPPNVTAEFLGQRHNREILDYYKNNPVSVFVNVSSSEGIPVTIMEAYSFGIPAIATDVGGTHEIVSDGGNGFLLRADFSPHELLDRLQQLRSMGDAEYNVLCVNARRTWREKFNAPGNYKRFYEEIST